MEYKETDRQKNKQKYIRDIEIFLTEEEKTSIANALRMDAKTATERFRDKPEFLLAEKNTGNRHIQIEAVPNPDGTPPALVGIRIADTENKLDIRNSYWLDDTDLPAIENGEHGLTRVPNAVEVFHLPAGPHDTPDLYDLVLLW